MGTYMMQALNGDVNQFRHLLVGSKDLAGPSPTAGWDGHAGKDPIVLHQATLEPHFDEDELNVGQLLHSLPELGAEFVELAKDLLP